MAGYAAIFWELIRKPFEHKDLIWGIVPLYFSWAVAELSGEKANFKTAIQTGFNLLWAGAQWTWQYTQAPGAGGRLGWSALFAVNVVVTIVTIALGAVALWSGLRRRFPRRGSFLGRTRFSSYFTISLFPVQANYLAWSWDRLIAVAIFAIPTWVALGVFRRMIGLARGGKK